MIYIVHHLHPHSKFQLERHPVRGDGTDMSKETLHRLRRAYGILLSFLLVITGVLLAVSCVQIYKSGDSPFTRERVATQFARIAVPVWITVAAVVMGGIGDLILSLTSRTSGEGARKITPMRSRSALYRRLVASCDLTSAPDVADILTRETKYRRRLSAIALLISAASAAPAVWWVLSPIHFEGEDKTADIRVAAIVVLGATAVAMLAWVLVGLLSARSYDRATATVKSAVAQKRLIRVAKASEALPNGRKTAALWSVRGVILVVAVAFIILGVANGGMADVLGKAIRICTECIGLG